MVTLNLLCFVVIALYAPYSVGREVGMWLQSPRITSWGDWGSVDLCPENTFVGSFKVKMEENVGESDDTALNGIEFSCRNMDGGSQQHVITSSIGPFGSWGGQSYCANGLATGFKLRSGSDQRSGDDVAAVDMVLFCINADGSKNEILGSGLHDWGSWTSEQNCPPAMAICGLKTQVEGIQGRGDDTSLNNVDVACCRLPSICSNCEVRSRWKRILACHQGLFDCSLQLGLKRRPPLPLHYPTQSDSFYSKGSTGTESGISKEKFSAPVSPGAEWAQEQVNGRTIEHILSSTFTESKEISITLDCVGWAEELVISSGPYELYTGDFRCTPFDNKGGGQTQQPSSNNEWQRSGNVQWRQNCDFKGGDIGSERSRGEECGGICERRSDCRNFVWTNYNNGTCWLKGDGMNPGVIDKFDSSAVCGWVYRTNQPSSDFHTSGNVRWKLNCDFEGGDIGSERGRGEDCGGICERRGDCTHFAWTNFNDGTCWLKGNGVNPGAIDKFDSVTVCGWVVNK